MSFEMEQVNKTLEHIKLVQTYLSNVINKLIERAILHDKSKFSEEEWKYFLEHTANLSKLTYGSDEYKAELKAMQPALEHHYTNNPHHPEYFIRQDRYILNISSAMGCMSLIDLIEMICDWLAATKRHDDGDIYKSIELNQKRFRYTDELKDILTNTIEVIEPEV